MLDINATYMADGRMETNESGASASTERHSLERKEDESVSAARAQSGGGRESEVDGSNRRGEENFRAQAAQQLSHKSNQILINKNTKVMTAAIAKNL